MYATPLRKLTIDEYIKLELNSEERYEFIDGEALCVTGSTVSHARITGNLCTSLHPKLRKTSNEVFNLTMRVKVPAGFPYRYPDASVACGAANFDYFHGQVMLVNPILIAEVLSPTTEAYDLGEKFSAYQSIESFREYLVIAQDRPHVIQYIKQSKNRWLRIEHEGLDSEMQVESLNITLTLAELYERVKF